MMESLVHLVATARAASLVTTQIQPGLRLVSAAGLSRGREQAYLGSQMSVMAGNSAGRAPLRLQPGTTFGRPTTGNHQAGEFCHGNGICSSARLVGHLALGSLCNL